MSFSRFTTSQDRDTHLFDFGFTDSHPDIPYLTGKESGHQLARFGPDRRSDKRKKIGITPMPLPGRDNECTLSGGHKVADCTTCKLAAWLGEVELQRGVGECDLEQRGE
jgi:hypothetical protein